MAGATIVFNHFPRFAKAMHVTAGQIVFETAEGILDDAFATVSANSKRTGDLANSGRTDYSDDGMEAIAGFDDFKADWIEYGTGAPGPTRAEPFLTPAAESHRGRFESAMKSLEPRLRFNAAGTVPLRPPTKRKRR